MNSTDLSFSFDNVAQEHWTIVAVGYFVVFLALSTLSIIFYNVPRVLNLRLRTSKKAQVAAIPEVKANDDITGEETAAIAAAIHFFFNELHDEENRVLTITKISKRYSPWNSKIYNVTNGLNRRF